MDWWMFPISVLSAYIGLVVGFHFVDRWAADRRRDRRVKEWVEMVKKQREEKEGWETRTIRDKWDEKR